MRLATSALLIAVAALAAAQAPLKTVTPEVAKTWERLGTWTVTRDGRWHAATVDRIDADGRLVVKENDGKNGFEVPNGSGPVFSPDGAWVAYRVSPPKAAAEKLRNERKPVETKLVWRELASGKETTVDAVATFQFLKSGPLIYRRAPAEGNKEGAAELGVVNLATGDTLILDAVTDFAANRAEDILAVETATARGTKSVVLLDPKAGTMRPLYTGPDSPAGLGFARKADVLGFMLGKEEPKKAGKDNRIVIVTDLRGAPKSRTLEPQKQAGYPAGSRLVDAAGLRLSDDGKVVSFGIGRWRPEVKPDPIASNVEIWNTMDLVTVPMQRVTAGADAQAASTAVWHLDQPAYRLVDEAGKTDAVLSSTGGIALVNDETPYLKAASDGTDVYDVRVIDTLTGVSRTLAKGLNFPARLSPTGRFAMTFDKGRWTVYDAATGKELAKTPAGFEETLDDHTVVQKPPSNGGTWLRDDAGWIVSDDFDLWRFTPGLGFAKMTDGRTAKLRHAVVDDRPDDGEFVSAAEPIFVTTQSPETKREGFGVIENGKFRSLIADDRAFISLRRAGETDRLLFVSLSETDSPALMVTNTRFEAMKPVLRTNPQQREYAWTRNRLVSYKSRWGAPLQGVLSYPADYQPGRQYPMVTYIYERLSDEMHNYQMPNPYAPYSVGELTQRGYFVFKPDIAYHRAGRPGEDAVDCLEPAVAAAAKMEPGIDAARVGLIGHSWGGYQTAFVTSVSKTFRVGVAGAPLTDLVSMANTHYWNVGMPNQPILETSQGRMRKPFYEAMTEYLANSPIWRSETRRAPILIAHGDADGAVDYHQGVALYNTLRRMGKPAVLVLYPGENHGLAKKSVREDYARRMYHYLDVHLRAIPAEGWVTSGTPLLDGREAVGKKD